MAIQDPFSHLGAGISFPLVRTGGDFENMSGVDLVMSSIPYILLTRGDGPGFQGEQPWDTGFGSQLLRLQHSSLSGDALRAFVEHYVVESLLINEPRIIVRAVDVEKIIGTGLGRDPKRPTQAPGNTLEISITVSVIDEDIDENDVRVNPDQTFTFNLPF